MTDETWRLLLTTIIVGVATTLKLINGSVRDTKEALAVHIAKGHGGLD
jgi:hypothetical protein